MSKRLCINCRDTYEDDDEEGNIWGYCWYCREVIYGDPDDSWLRRIDFRELKNFHIEEIPEEESEE